MADARPRVATKIGILRSAARQIGCGFIALWLALMATGPAAAEQTPGLKSAGGLSVYMGVVPAEIVKGYAPERPEDKMHRGAPRGPHDYHVMVAIFDSATGARVSDATVSAQVSGIGLAGPKRNLEPMEVAGAMTYGNFFDLPGRDVYTVRLEVRRKPSEAPVTFEFKYDHRNDR